MSKQIAVVALGLNNSDVQSELIDKSESISQCFSASESIKRSSLFATPAFPKGSGPDYINTVIMLETDLTPEMLLERLHRIENSFHRDRPYRWAPRSCDLDLIFYEQAILPSKAEFKKYADFTTEQAMETTPDELILPHPRLHERAFVLGPLREIAPDFIHPVFHKTVEELWLELPQEQRNEIRKLT